MAARAVYFDPPYVTDVPFAYAAQLANAGRPVQVAALAAPAGSSVTTPNAKTTAPCRRLTVISTRSISSSLRGIPRGLPFV
jgi:hypothetical protein